MAYITAHYKERVSLKDVAQAVNLSPFRIATSSKSRPENHYTARDTDENKQSREMLEKTDKSCSEIAMR